MAGPGDDITAGAEARGPLRASHADREQVIETLKAAYVQGMLAKDEFDLRVGQTFASRTYAELAALTADIPARVAGVRPPEPARESVNKKAVAAVACATAALIGMWHVNPPDGSPFAIPVFVVTLALLLAAPTGWLLLFHDWLDKRAGRRSAQGLPPGAGGEVSQRLAAAEAAGQLPQPGHDLRHAAEAVRSRLSRPSFPVCGAPRRGHSLVRRYATGGPSH
jgi:Domain of unknown function (DUF1707)